jgi:polysaccharide export outer membrane protein
MKRFSIISFIAVVILTASSLSASAQEGAVGSSEYRIGVGDILEIVTWKEPDFSREEVLVRLDGKLSFPLINDIMAAGKTTTELKELIEKKLMDYVASANVTITIRNAASQRFYILGEVTNTGEYPLTKDLTVLQAFALAGGFTEWASKNEIILFRREGGKEQVFRINYKKIVKDQDFSQNVNIRANDTIIVP